MDEVKSKVGYVYAVRSMLNGKDVYIGSTTRTLNERLNEHMYNYNHDKRSNCSVNEILSDGRENLLCYILETVEYTDRKDLYMRELFWIENLSNVVNKKVPIQNREQFLQKRREYYERNKDLIQQRNKVTVNCPHCNISMCRNSLYSHLRNRICQK